MLMGEEKPKYDFSKYRTQLKIKRTPTNERSYSRWGYYHSDPVREDFTIDEIKQIIRSGNLESLRQLSRYFYRTNSLYRNNIDFLSYMPTYDTVVIPVYQEGKGSKAQITKAFYNVYLKSKSIEFEINTVSFNIFDGFKKFKINILT